ncbi:MAG: hypothetical protein KGJ07_04250 [Patescibacteria group bacterium]|nr:hypothetical protein [Patescibacteria group bacterium]MDE2590350.1 hypothetical protein [Patescibacteria group bacterium]
MSRLHLMVRNVPYSWPSKERGLGVFSHIVPENKKPERQKVFVTGHMEDKPGRANPRLPSTELPLVRFALREQLEELYTRHSGNIDLVLCSGTAGTDLLAVEWVLEKIHAAEATKKSLNLGVNIYLPYAESDFLTEAVDFGPNPEKWVEIYMEAKMRGFVHEPYGKDPFVDDEKKVKTIVMTREAVRRANEKRRIRRDAWDYQPYVDLNMYMLDQLSPSDYIIAVWDGKGGDTPGGTQHGITLFADAVFEGGYEEIPTDQIRIINYGIRNSNRIEDYGAFARFLREHPNLTPNQIEQLQTQWYAGIDQSKQRRNILPNGI